MTIKSNGYKAAGLNDLNKLSTNNQEILKGLRETIETTEPKMRKNSARKRKSDDVVDTSSVDESTRVPDFVRNDLIATPTILNSRDAFFDKKNSPLCQLTDSPPVESSIDKECVIKTAKSFFDDDDRESRQISSRYSPRRSPTSFRREIQTKPLHNGTSVGSPCGVVDELFTGFYGCMNPWECLPWTGQESDDEETHRYGVVRRDTARHDRKAMYDHLSFPEHLGRGNISQSQESHRERNNMTVNRTIRRTPSSRLTTLETDSRHKLPGSKMFRRTDINRVTEIHWDEEVLDTKTLEQMANLSVY